MPHSEAGPIKSQMPGLGALEGAGSCLGEGAILILSLTWNIVYFEGVVEKASMGRTVPRPGTWQEPHWRWCVSVSGQHGVTRFFHCRAELRGEAGRGLGRVQPALACMQPAMSCLPHGSKGKEGSRQEPQTHREVKRSVGEAHTAASRGGGAAGRQQPRAQSPGMLHTLVGAAV